MAAGQRFFNTTGFGGGNKVTIVWDQSAVKAWTDHGLQSQAALDIAAAMVVQEMKRLAPVSPVFPTYASPVPLGRSVGPAYQRRGAGLARPGGAAVSRRRLGGDLPLRPSGYLRSSIRAFRMPDGSVIIGPTAPYGRFVNDGTPPLDIYSTGPWPLRNRATGQVFGPHVKHPGTKPTLFVQRSAEILRGVVL